MTQGEASLGQIEYQATVSSVQNSLNKKREKIKLADKEQYDIGKYSSVHGASIAVRKFKKSNPSLKKKYEE